MTRPEYPCSPILLADGRGVMCPNDPCYGLKTWKPAEGESPCCIKCAAAWHEIDTAKERQR